MFILTLYQKSHDFFNYEQHSPIIEQAVCKSRIQLSLSFSNLVPVGVPQSSIPLVKERKRNIPFHL